MAAFAALAGLASLAAWLAEVEVDDSSPYLCKQETRQGIGLWVGGGTAAAAWPAPGAPRQLLKGVAPTSPRPAPGQHPTSPRRPGRESIT